MAQNDNFEWLTYETIFQQQRFARTNEKLKIGLYAIQRSKVTVFFRFDLTDEQLTSLTDAFFPFVTDDKTHRKQADETWPWKEHSSTPTGFPVSPSGDVLTSNPAVIRLFLDEFVILPYNHLDNDRTSQALGTSELPIIKQLKPDRMWEFWKTASRSCVMRTKRVKQTGEDWLLVYEPAWKAWNFAEGDAKRASFTMPSGPPAAGYPMLKKTPADFSVKTGVIYVGSENQKNASKDNLDSNWWIACLRSDYVAIVDKEMGSRRHADSKIDDIVVLTELLSINEKDSRSSEGNKDGIQVRDISPLQKNCVYIPPLSIPVIGSDFKTRSSEFVNLTDKTWCDFWRDAWAAPLGRAKALFLLRYGLQHLNPNVQNYLIEFTTDAPPAPTHRIIIRDLQDASLHREVVWALYGPDGQPPPTDRDGRTELVKLKLGVLSYEFTRDMIEDSQETGSVATEKGFGNPGLQFLWNRFSMFGGNNKHEDFVKRMFNDGNEETFEKIAKEELDAVQIQEKLFEIKRAPFLQTLADDNERQRYLEYDKLVKELTRKYSTRYGKDDNKIKIAVGDDVKKKFTVVPQRMKFSQLSSQIASEARDELEKIKRAQDSAQEKTCKKLLYVMADWGRAHNLAYVRTIESLLGVNLGIPWDTLPDADRHLLLEKIDYKSELDWEEANAKIVQAYLTTAEGQDKIRKYKERNWKAADPVFRLQVLDTNSRPIENSPLKIINTAGSRRWVDLSDRQGYLYVYQGKPEEYSFEIISSYDLAGGSFAVADVKALPSGPMLDFDYIKIKFVAG